MSKRAEEKALEKYPVDICGYTVECRVGAKPQPQDWNEIRRTHFQEGYEQAEKDTLERVILWLKDNANKYIVDIGVGYGEHGRNVELIVGGTCWEDLKKAMEEEL